MRRRWRLGRGDLPQGRDRAGRFVDPGEETVAHDRIEPGAQIRARLPQIGIGERLDQGILDEVVGVRLVAVPAAHRAAQKRDLVFELAQIFRRGRGAGPRLDRSAPGGGRQQLGFGIGVLGRFGTGLHSRKFPTKTAKNSRFDGAGRKVLPQKLCL